MRRSSFAFALCLPKSQALTSRKQAFAAKSVLARYVAMSLPFIAAGVLACLFGLIALLPSFDGRWEP